MATLKFFSVVLLAVVVSCDIGITGGGGGGGYDYNNNNNNQAAGYNYNSNNAGGGNYPGVNDGQGYGGHGGGHGNGHYDETPKPYQFGYAVQDQYSGNDYKRHETSDGNVVQGEYRVALPDGRTQIVRYQADWQNGFHADVSYEGEAHYPDTHGNQGGYNNNNNQGGYNNNNNNNNYNNAPYNSYGPPGY